MNSRCGRTLLDTCADRVGVRLGRRRAWRAICRSVARPIAPGKAVDSGVCQEVVVSGEDVDLTALPIPFMHEKDGGPYISAGVAFAKDPQLGPNAGCYRLMFRTQRELGIDLFTASDLRRYYQAAFDKNEPLPIAVAIRVHVFEHMAAPTRRPPDSTRCTLPADCAASLCRWCAARPST